MNITIKHKSRLSGAFSMPGDKSISHRAIILGALALGETHISGFLTGADCLSTISCFKKLGIDIDINGCDVTVFGKGIHGLSSPTGVLDVGNSGTTLRLLSGILSASNFTSTITGDSSIQKRPMDRVAVPLSLMGAKIHSTGGERIYSPTGTERIYAPLTISGTKLCGIQYTLPVASAQVKSAIILAALYANGETVIHEPEPTRDHTEIMLNYLGAGIYRHGAYIHCPSVSQLYGKDISIPGDISSAAYFIVAGCICDCSKIHLTNIGINPTRTGILSVLTSMGGRIEITNTREVCGEAVGDITVETSKLSGVIIGGETIPTLIDEIPILAVAACFASGTTIIRDAEELMVKESNRIKTVVTELKKMGADIEETGDGMIINGTRELFGAITESYDDHRIAMSIAIAALAAHGETTISDFQCVDISFPNFFSYIERL